MKTRIIYLLTVLAVGATVHRATAQNTTFTYQGRVQDNGTNYSGMGQFEFALVTTNANTTSTWWSNDGTGAGGSEPKAAVTVGVTNGLFTVVLGSSSVSNMAVLPAAVFVQPGLELEVWFSDLVNGFNAFPLQPLTAAPYATYAATAGSVVNNTASLTSSNLTLTGSLDLPGTTTIDAGGSTLMHVDGNFNFFAGQNAGNLTNNGTYNVALGQDALGSVGNGSGNTAIGVDALGFDTTGFFNTAIGEFALSLNKSGNNNTANGANALSDNTTGNNNVALGAGASYNTSGTNNIGLGFLAGYNILAGNNNIDIGNQGSGGDTGVIRIGTPGTQTQTFLSGTTLVPALNVDPNGLNIGNLNSNAVTFGSSSGEGICSKRTNGTTNRYDLELWTDFTERLKVAQGGNVGINTDNPTAALDVNGTSMVVEGGSSAGAARAFIGDNNTTTPVVQIGSMAAGVTEVDFVNLASIAPMAIHCSSITIEGGSDLAEPFAITQAEEPVSEGEVVVIDAAHPGQLKLTDRPYDTRVAGVVSGANGIHPGIQMHQQGLLDGGRNVALTGRVYVQADTSNGAIEPGDLLTTSSTPGRAMRVSDHARAEGAILGKAMTALNDGRGMVLVLVTLQ